MYERTIQSRILTKQSNWATLVQATNAVYNAYGNVYCFYYT